MPAAHDVACVSFKIASPGQVSVSVAVPADGCANPSDQGRAAGRAPAL